MKKFILSLAAIICLVMPAMAEENLEQYLGLQFGYAHPTLYTNDPTNANPKQLDVENYNGIKAGLTYDATLIKGFGFNMAINYTYGSAHTDWTAQYTTMLWPKIRTRSQYHQVEVAVDWQYKFEIAKSTYLILYSGPSIQCGISMVDKWYVQMMEGEETLSKTLYYYDETKMAEVGMKDYTLKRLNVTWGVGAGFQYERYFIRGGYDFGLINPFKAQSFTGYDTYTRGHFDQWAIKIGAYLWDF